MSQFEDAVRRANAEWQRESDTAAQQVRSLSEMAATLAPELQRQLAEFAQYLGAYFPTRSHKVPSPRLIKSKSPAGVVISINTVHSTINAFWLVTPDGRVWNNNSKFLDLSAAALVRQHQHGIGISAIGSVVIHDGRLQVQHANADTGPWYTPLHEELAKVAAYLIAHPLPQAHPEFFK